MPTPYKYPYRPEGWGKDIYPMPAFSQLIVSDVNRSSEWYQQTLGFADVFTMRMPDGTPMVAHLRWCSFGDVLLIPARGQVREPRGSGVILNFSTEDADAIAARAVSHGVQPIEGPVDRPWNTRDVAFRDPDGYRLNFTAPSAATLANVANGTFENLDSVVERLRKTFKRP